MNLSYQTLRYKGHLDKIKSLKEFGLLNQCAIRDLSKHINIPVCKKDITLFVVVAKKKDLTYSYSLEVYGDDEISGLAVATTAPIIELIDVIKNCESYNLTGVFLPYLIPDDPLNDESYFLPSLKYIDAGKYNITTREVKTDVN